MTQTTITCFQQRSQVLVWDVRTPAVPVSIIGWGEGAEESSSHGMVTSLLLDSVEHGACTAGETGQGAGSGLSVLAGYEDGNLSCFDLRNCRCNRVSAPPLSATILTAAFRSEPLAKIKPHSDPIFALDTSPRNSATVVTGAADSFLCRSRLAGLEGESSCQAPSGERRAFETVDSVDAKSTGEIAVSLSRFRLQN